MATEPDERQAELEAEIERLRKLVAQRKNGTNGK
jgi:uncharacterized small protein (DUF1192 family)